MPLADPLITETTDRIFTSLCTPALVTMPRMGSGRHRCGQRSRKPGSKRLGFHSPWAERARVWPDGFAVARIAGRHAAPVPIADTLAANRLLSAAQLQVPDGMAGLCTEQGDTSLQIDAAGVLSGTAARVPFGRSVGRSCSGLPSQR